MVNLYFENCIFIAPSTPGPTSGFQSADEEIEHLSIEVLEKHEVSFKNCKTILLVKNKIISLVS